MYTVYSALYTGYLEIRLLVRVVLDHEHIENPQPLGVLLKYIHAV